MGTRGKEIVGADVEKLVDMLNRALADEWLAYYQYWVGAKIIQGPMRGAVAGELEEHAGEELEHAGMLTERILQLGGTPLIKPQDWFEMTNCGYEVPEDSYVEALLEQNIKGERCAIDVYQKLADFTRDIDPITYHLAVEILEDEVEHEEDLEAFAEDIELMKARRA